MTHSSTLCLAFDSQTQGLQRDMAETKSGVLIVPRLNAIVNEPDLRVAILGSVQNMTWKCMYKRVVEVAAVERPKWLFYIAQENKGLK